LHCILKCIIITTKKKETYLSKSEFKDGFTKTSGGRKIWEASLRDAKPTILGTGRWKEERRRRKRQIGYVNECEGGDDWEVFWEVWKQTDIFFLLINLGYKESPHKQTP